MPLLSQTLKSTNYSPSDRWEKIGNSHIVNFYEDETEIYIVKKPRNGKVFSLDRYVIENNWEGLVFIGHPMLKNNDVMNTGLVHAKILSHDVVNKIDTDNPLDKALIEMGALDELLMDLTEE